jgi:hypothetical protein
MMKKNVNSYLWIPDIIRLSGYFEEKNDSSVNNCEEENNPKCKNNKNSCKNSKIKFVKGKGRYVYWNFKPNMIIDLDLIELNSKHPTNVILLEKRKK